MLGPVVPLHHRSEASPRTSSASTGDHSSGVIAPLVVHTEGLDQHLVNLLLGEGFAGGGQFAALTQTHTPKQEPLSLALGTVVDGSPCVEP